MRAAGTPGSRAAPQAACWHAAWAFVLQKSRRCTSNALKDKKNTNNCLPPANSITPYPQQYQGCATRAAHHGVHIAVQAAAGHVVDDVRARGDRRARHRAVERVNGDQDAAQRLVRRERPARSGSMTDSGYMDRISVGHSHFASLPARAPVSRSSVAAHARSRTRAPRSCRCRRQSLPTSELCPGCAPDDGHNARSLCLRAHARRAGPCGLATDVEDVCARGCQRAAGGQRACGGRDAAAVAEAVWRHIQHAHHVRAPLRRSGPGGPSHTRRGVRSPPGALAHARHAPSAHRSCGSYLPFDAWWVNTHSVSDLQAPGLVPSGLPPR